VSTYFYVDTYFPHFYKLTDVNTATTGRLHKTHVLSIFFDTLMRDKAVPIFEGPAGGGKNTLTQMTGMLFEGQKFNVNPMPSSGKELDEQTVECIYAGFDEFDSHDSEMERAFRFVVHAAVG